MRKVRHRGVSKVHWIFYPGLCRLQSGAHAKPGSRNSRGGKSRPTCRSSNIELEAEATKAPEIKPFDIINDEQQKEKHAANQFFSSLLG
jgi:hypothetical protein